MIGNCESVIVAAAWVAAVLIIWLQTTAVEEYFKFLPIVKQYHQYKQTRIGTTFIRFLQTDHNCFLVRLITCAFCLGAILSGVCAIWIPVAYIAGVYVIALLIYQGIVGKLSK